MFEFGAGRATRVYLREWRCCIGRTLSGSPLRLADVGVSRVVLFGSVARGDAAERSDIDLAAIYEGLDYGTAPSG